MNEVIVATIITECGKFLSEVIRTQRRARPAGEVEWPAVPDQPEWLDQINKGTFKAGSVSLPAQNRTESVSFPAPLPAQNRTEPEIKVNYAPVQSMTGEKVATSCVGCAIGHLATVAGLLKEAVRFTKEGMDSPNIVDRLNTCLDELNAMERVDLIPNKIADLPEWEKDLAHRALDISRETRHYIEAGISSGDELERISAGLINERQAIGNAWLQQKLRALSKEDKAEIQRRVMAKLENIGEEKE